MPVDQGALIVADIGSLLTHVFLIDVVGDFYRLIARTETFSTIEPPRADCTIGMYEGIRQLEGLTGRALMADDRLIMAQRPDGAGVDGLVVTSSAAGNLPIVIAAIAEEASGRSALRATRSTYTSLLELVTLDDQAKQNGSAATTWIDRQVQALKGLAPQAVVITGGVEGGAQATIVQLARLLALTVLDRPQKEGPIPIIFAGNSLAQQAVSDALADIAPVTMVANVRPSLDQEDLAPLRHELMRIYDARVLANLPGVDKLRALTPARPRSGSEGYHTIARFMGRYHERPILLVDIGAASTACYYADQHDTSPTVRGNGGIVYGGPALLEQIGAEAITRWLPFELDQQGLTHRLLNQLVRAQLLPSSRDDLLIAQAVAREALRQVFAALQEERPGLEVDLIVAGGGVLTHTAHAAQAALVVLDALQPGSRGLMVTELYLDSLGLLPACGALAPYNPDAAYCLLEQDILRGGPLATVVVPVGSGKEGETAVEVELTPVGGTPVTLSVAHGDIRRLPLPRGKRATLRIKPSSGVRIGQNDAGKEVSSDEAAISGSALGIVIDARGRPIRLPEDPVKRQQKAWEWYTSLSGTREKNPYRPSELTPEVVAQVERKISQPLKPKEDQPPPLELPPWMPEPVAADAQPSGGVQDLGERETTQPAAEGDDEFANIRSALAPPKPKKKGFFGKK